MALSSSSQPVHYTAGHYTAAQVRAYRAAASRVAAHAKTAAKAHAAYEAAKATAAHTAYEKAAAAKAAAAKAAADKDAAVKAAAAAKAKAAAIAAAKARRSGAPKPPVSPSPTTAPTPAPSPTTAPTPPTAPSPTSVPKPTPPNTPKPTPPTTTPAPTTPTTPRSTGSNVAPNASNTGVPAGTTLTVYNGNLTITTAGATYSGLDIHGFVSVQAPNVTIKNSIIRGGVASGDIGLVQDVSNSATNFLIEDSELVPSNPSVQIDGIKGWNYTALRVNIHGTTDGIKMYGPNATLQDSYIHGLVTYAHDPDQGGKQSHNDGVQVLSGTNLLVKGNTIVGGTNTALMVTQDHGTTGTLAFNNNWLSGGNCTINMTPKPMKSMGAMTIDNNIFTNDSTLHCPILDTLTTNLHASGNVYAGTGQAVPVNDKGGE